ncbi:unnamed protein product, partial [Adineta steineri]
SLNDAYNIYETIEHISAIGVRKSKQKIDHMIIKSFLAGVLLSFGGLFCLTVGGGNTLLAQNFGPGIHKTIQAAVFPISFILVIVTGEDLFIGNTMVLVISTLHIKTTWINLLILWSISFCGSLIGFICFQYFLVYHAGLLTYDPYLSYTIKYAELKGNTPCARDLNSKIIGIYLPIWLFVAVGYEHSTANMFTVQMGMLLGANLSIGNYILNVLIPVTLGNILGGGIFVGFIYWHLYLAKQPDNDINIGMKILNKDVYLGVKQHDDIIQS